MPEDNINNITLEDDVESLPKHPYWELKTVQDLEAFWYHTDTSAIIRLIRHNVDRHVVSVDTPRSDTYTTVSEHSDLTTAIHTVETCFSLYHIGYNDAITEEMLTTIQAPR